MKRPLLALLLPAVVAVHACAERTGTPAPAAHPEGIVALDENARQHAGITVAPVETTVRAEQTEAPGVIALDERRTARIGSLVEGILLETMAEVGDRVRAGQVLATMHSTVVHEAWAGYRKAIAERRRLDKELAFAVAAHERDSFCRWRRPPCDRGTGLRLEPVDDLVGAAVDSTFRAGVVRGVVRA